MHTLNVTYVDSELEARYLNSNEAVPVQVVDKQVSRKHMQIRHGKAIECCYATDMTSRNGVFINGRKINEESVLADGDRTLVPS